MSNEEQRKPTQFSIEPAGSLALQDIELIHDRLKAGSIDPGQAVNMVDQAGRPGGLLGGTSPDFLKQ